MADLSATNVAATEARNRGGRPPKISRAKVLEAAATLRLEEVTMTAVAAKLGVKHSSLYTYFPSQAALVAAVCAELGKQLDIPRPEGLSWQEWIVEAGFGCRDFMATNLGTSGALITSGLEAACETLMGTFVEVFVAAGFTSLATWDAWELFSGCCLMAALGVRRLQDAQANLAWYQSLYDDRASIEERLSPAMRKVLADVTASFDPDAGFRRELDTLIAGWSHQLGRQAKAPRRRRK